MHNACMLKRMKLEYTSLKIVIDELYMYIVLLQVLWYMQEIFCQGEPSLRCLWPVSNKSKIGYTISEKIFFMTRMDRWMLCCYGESLFLQYWAIYVVIVNHCSCSIGPLTSIALYVVMVNHCSCSMGPLTSIALSVTGAWNRVSSIVMSASPVSSKTTPAIVLLKVCIW